MHPLHECDRRLIGMEASGCLGAADQRSGLDKCAVKLYAAYQNEFIRDQLIQACSYTQEGMFSVCCRRDSHCCHHLLSVAGYET